MVNYSPNKDDMGVLDDIKELAITYLSAYMRQTDINEALLTVNIGLTCQLIRNYCNLDDSESVPSQLQYVWAEIASKKYLLATTGFSSSLDENGNVVVGMKGKVGSVTDGSQSVSYDYSSGADSLTSSEEDKKLLSGFSKQLDRYKEVRWYK